MWNIIKLKVEKIWLLEWFAKVLEQEYPEYAILGKTISNGKLKKSALRYICLQRKVMKRGRGERNGEKYLEAPLDTCLSELKSLSLDIYGDWAMLKSMITRGNYIFILYDTILFFQNARPAG